MTTDAFDPEPERAADVESWRGVAQGANEDVALDQAIASAVANERERIAKAIERNRIIGADNPPSMHTIGWNTATRRAAMVARLGACPTCTGQVRETVGLVCQTCGHDFGADE